MAQLARPSARRKEAKGLLDKRETRMEGRFEGVHHNGARTPSAAPGDRWQEPEKLGEWRKKLLSRRDEYLLNSTVTLFVKYKQILQDRSSVRKRRFSLLQGTNKCSLVGARRPLNCSLNGRFGRHTIFVSLRFIEKLIQHVAV